jgi:hypothetical protein
VLKHITDADDAHQLIAVLDRAHGEIRRVVISFMTSVTLSSGEQTATAFVVGLVIVGNRLPYVASPGKLALGNQTFNRTPVAADDQGTNCSARICPESRSAVS